MSLEVLRPSTTVKFKVMRNIVKFLCSATQPTLNTALWMKRKANRLVIIFTRRNSHKNHMEIYGDRDRQYHIRRIRVLNRSGEQEDFYVMQNIPDGNCLFRAISQAIFKNEANHSSIRQDVVNYITGSAKWKDYFPYIRGQHEHLAQRQHSHRRDDGTVRKLTYEDRDRLSSSSTPTYGDDVGKKSLSTLAAQQSSMKSMLSPPTPSIATPTKSPSPPEIDDLNNINYSSAVRDYETSTLPSSEDGNLYLSSLTDSGADVSPADGCSAISTPTASDQNHAVSAKNVNTSGGNDGSRRQSSEELKETNNSSSNDGNESNNEEEEREILRQEYKRYMLTEKAYGTLQELVAAAEFFKFNLVVFREIPNGGFNVQTFSESKYDVTHCFLFTGHQEDGHFELMDRSQSTKTPIQIYNGSYVQVDHSSKTGFVTIQDQTPSESKQKNSDGCRKKRKKRKRWFRSSSPTLLTPVSVVEIMAPVGSDQAMKHSSSFYDIPCRLRVSGKVS